MDRWEEGFDTWIPPASEAVDTRAEDERRELLRLARELGAARDAAHEPPTVELEPLKRALREAAEAVAAHGRELAELRGRLEAELAATQAERELAAAEREKLEERERAIHTVERELAGIRVALDQERSRLEEQPSFAEGIAELSPKARGGDPASAAGR